MLKPQVSTPKLSIPHHSGHECQPRTEKNNKKEAYKNY